MARRLSLFRPGDFLLILLGVALVAGLAGRSFSDDQTRPTRALVYVGGKLTADIRLPVRQRLSFDGPLGNTVVDLDAYRARIDQDPGPKQYCVMQGWLTRAGDVDICLPNRVTLQLKGGEAVHDSLHY